MYDLDVSYTFNLNKKLQKLPIIFLRNGVLILIGKENKEVGAICFELRVPRKKNKEIFWNGTNVERKYWMIIFDVIYDLLEGKEEAQELRTTLCRI